jgi:gamma-glutamyl:cysteine ligase YbdK (ATP-grasp superfamily)
MNTVQIKDSKLVRDIHSKAVLNTDRAELNNYYMKREIVKKQREEQSETKVKISQLEQEMREIKQILLEIADLRKN